MRRRAEDVFTAQIDDVLAEGFRWLAFPPALEARFEEDTGRARCRSVPPRQDTTIQATGAYCSGTALLSLVKRNPRAVCASKDWTRVRPKAVAAATATEPASYSGNSVASSH
jgi:hypothetical protein